MRGSRKTRKTAAKRPSARKVRRPGRSSDAPAADDRDDAGAQRRNGALTVGIGASAGGLEAFEKFLSRMPRDSGMSFILVPHLDAHHRSAMTELLQRITQMSVVEIADGMSPEPDRVHIIPPNGTLTMERGVLRVATPRGQSNTIDVFFRSLAEDRGEQAIGVVLSGSGSDGALGIKAIKERGGLTVAAASESSRFDSMPHSAVATGLVDLILPVEEMPPKLVEYARRWAAARDRRGADAMRKDGGKHLLKIYTLLRSATGHDFSRYKDSTFIRRVQRRMQVVRLSAVKDYVELLQKDLREIELLFRDLLIGVTHFFRDPRAFEALAREVLPKLPANKGADDQIRVWVPGCATGEEAYSIAILLREHLTHVDAAPKVQIFATDIDDRALDQARLGRYPEAIARDLSPERLQRFFLREGNAYRVAKEIREMCVFSVHNLIKDAPFSRLDLISCRNLLIYLDQSLQNRVIPLFHFSLRHGGYLFLGPSENVAAHSKLFAKVNGRYRIFKARQGAVERPAVEFPVASRGYRAPLAEKTGLPVATEDTVTRRAMRLVEAYAPAYVVVDEHQDVLHFSGRTGKYIQPSTGAASLNLFNLLETSLRPDVRAALHKAMATGRKVIEENIPMMVDGGDQAVTLVVEPLAPINGGGRFFVVLFQDAGRVKPHEAGAAAATADRNEAVAHLEVELTAMRERLQTTVEELEASNEEMRASNEEFQSVNEELQSSNEELETAKEELQSVNEELETVNAELNSKIETLERAINDRKNLLESTQIATMFLDERLRIKNFTPAILDIFPLVESDYGRPVTDIVTRLSYTDLERDVRKVLRTLERVEQEVMLADGGITYMMRILPYRTVDNVIDGVVITFVDITERRRNEEDLARLASIVATSHDAIIGLTPAGTVMTWNAGAERIYGYAAREVLGQPWSVMMDPERPSELGVVLERVKRSRVASTVEADRVTKDGRRLHVASTVSPIHNPAGKLTALSAIERDVTERKQADERQRMLLAELDHRVKNTLATVISIATQTLRHKTSLDGFREVFEGRIRALAKAHDLLGASNWAGADLREVVMTELAPHRESSDSFSVEGEATFLSPNAALVLGMAFHELATNAAKYGAFTTREGRVDVAWKKDERSRRLVIEWTERNAPPIEGAPQNGFGLTLIDRGLAHQLQGRATFDFADGGLRCSLEIPLAEALAGTAVPAGTGAP